MRLCSDVLVNIIGYNLQSQSICLYSYAYPYNPSTLSLPLAYLRILLYYNTTISTITPTMLLLLLVAIVVEQLLLLKLFSLLNHDHHDHDY